LSMKRGNMDDNAGREWLTGKKLVDGHEVDFVIDLLMMDHTVRELRQIASDLNVKRERGDNKRDTAAKIVYQAENRLSVVNTEHNTQEVVFDR